MSKEQQGPVSLFGRRKDGSSYYNDEAERISEAVCGEVKSILEGAIERRGPIDVRDFEHVAIRAVQDVTTELLAFPTPNQEKT
jgi:hypothetical protein